jgi:hypothetical protein
MNREWVTLAFGIVLVMAVAVVSVWQNYPAEQTDPAATASLEAPAETPAMPDERQTPAAGARGTTARPTKPAATAGSAPAPTSTARVDARLPVVHKHRFGDCQGTLRAVSGTLTYSTDHTEDAFRVPFAELDEFELDSDKKNLRIRRDGKTWNFTTRGETGPALSTFHTEAARLRR